MTMIESSSVWPEKQATSIFNITLFELNLAGGSMDERLRSASNDNLWFRQWSLQVSTIMHHAVEHETEGQA